MEMTCIFNNITAPTKAPIFGERQ